MIPLSVPNLSGNELAYVNQALVDGWVSTGGPSITRFEDEFACYSGVEYVTACQSGTAALHLALAESGIGAGDLVAAPVLTFIASVNPIRYVGAEPVFMDCDDSLCIDPAKFGFYLGSECEMRDDGFCYDRSLDRPVKAVIAAHIFGNTVDMERMAPLCKKYNIIIIEDAAEAVGTFFSTGAYAGKMAGTIGDYGAFSFNGNKIITTGGGGMITSPDFRRVQRMKHLSTQAKTDEVFYTHDEIGYNYRMTNVQAAIGLAQLEQLEVFVDIKRANYSLYREHGVELLPFRDGCRPNYWFYSYVCQADKQYRDGLIRHLFNRGIQTRPPWALCHEQPMYVNCKAFNIERAHYYHARIINLPCSTNLSADDISRVAEEIHAYG
ncbi:MAG: DegT/DnrJ/EryC1/StrS family aminotransferase [Oscillospiraceae bacterium]|nr:DegT/DnrJ/EryC1/StrS family aminotransferase [Oscillospiraceae bacterium]